MNCLLFIINLFQLFQLLQNRIKIRVRINFGYKLSIAHMVGGILSIFLNIQKSIYYAEHP